MERYCLSRADNFSDLIFQNLTILQIACTGLNKHLLIFWTSLIAQLVKNPPAMQETPVWSLNWEDPLEKEKATHSRILAWRIPWIVCIFHGVAKSQTWLSNFTFTLLIFKDNKPIYSIRRLHLKPYRRAENNKSSLHKVTHMIHLWIWYQSWI